MAEDYVAAEDNPYNALYEQPGLRALLPPVAGRRVLDAGCGAGRTAAWLAAQGADVVGIDTSPERPHGAFVFTTHHPFMDLGLSPSGDYHATEPIVDRWALGDREYDVRFWRRPLSETFRAIADAGFEIEALSEPQPLPEVRDRFREAWERLTKSPHFLFLRLVAR